jgi:DNA polymerase I-like protein with 3'-5' exonuclease and polymerase domains
MSVDWKPPGELPDLRNVGTVALDLETRDGGLLAECGSGWAWGDGYICGIAIAYRDDGAIRAHYFPLRHPDSQNFGREQLLRWLQDLVASDVHIITQNGLYDWGWVRADFGIKMPPPERLEELGALATMVDENRHRYGLDALCAWRNLPGKDETLLREGCAALELSPKKSRKKLKLQKYIWQLPAHYVGPYAETDAARTLAVFENLTPVLDRENTRDAYRLEVALLPMVHEMRRRGIRIDTAAAECAREQLLRKRDAVFAELSEKLGATVGMAEIGRTKWLAETFDQQKIKYPRTEKGNPSFTAGNSGWMPKHPHWLPRLIVQADKYNNAAVNVLETYILGHIKRGRVHAEIHPHRSDEGGTRSLRFSYSDPPLQLMPAHDEELAPLIRGVFLPEEGEVWAKPDLSQQEFRFIVHYAARHKLAKANEAVARYRNDPDTDFHAFVSMMTGRDRQTSKNTNFAKAFGAGVRKFAAMINKPESEAQAIYDQYDRELPFVSQLSRLCEQAARRDGYITLYDGARRHFNQWAVGGKWKTGAGPCDRDEAIRRVNDPDHPWHRQKLWRADVRKAMNALIQGSAACHTKRWMHACWCEGIVPLLQMHDALDCSVNSPEQAELVARLGCEAVELEVPMRVDLAFGRTWGDAKHTWAELHAKTCPHVELTVELSDDRERTQRESPKLSSDLDGAPDLTPSETIVADTALPWEGTTQFPEPKNTDTPAHVDGFGGFTTDVEGYDPGKINCPFHEEKTPSCQLYADGHYHCFGCGAHGWIDEDMDLPDDVLARAANAKSNSQTLERGLELWAESKPITGTLAASYLADTRKLDLTALPTDVNAVLRFHPHCPFGTNGAHHPCLLALFRDVELDTQAGIHRIGLTPDGNKIKRLSFGRWPSPRAIKLWPAASELVIGEGVETVLGAIRRGAAAPPAWAMGPKTDIGRFPVLPDVKTLTILVDKGDAKALDGAKTCAARYVAADRVVRLLITTRVKDFNDLVMP